MVSSPVSELEVVLLPRTCLRSNMKRIQITSVDVEDNESNRNFPKFVKFATTDRVPAGTKFASFKRKTSCERVLTARTDHATFVNTSPCQRTFLAAVNKLTGECRLMSAGFYHLSPVLPCAEDEQNSADVKCELTPAASAVQLGQTFGLARWKKMQRRSDRLKVSTESLLVGETLDNTLKEMAVCETPGHEASVQGEAAADTRVEDASGLPLLPPCNWLAADRDSVYQRCDLVPDNVWTVLQKTTEHFNQQLLRHQSNYPYIMDRVSMLPSHDEHRFLLVSYAFYLLRLLKYMNDRFVKLNWKQLEIPEKILSHMRVQFMERSHRGWDRSCRLVDKLVCYFMVVALWIHQYVLDLSIISSAVGLPVKRVMKYAQCLGMTVSGNTAVLKLPLYRRAETSASSRRLQAVAKM